MVLSQNIQPLLANEIHPRERENRATYRAYSFGQFRLYCENNLIKDAMWRRNKAKTLLKWFLLNPEKLYSADELVDLFWPDLPLETAFCNLHVTIHCLRRLLEPSLTSRQESRFVRRQGNNFYWFDMGASWWTDTEDVRHLFEVARVFDTQQEYTKASFYYRKVASYCCLEFLPEDEADRWLAPYRHHYEYIYSQALLRLIHIYGQRNELDEMLEYAYQALSLDQYCEQAVKAIVNAHVKQGHVSLAVHKLDTFQRVLHNGLGLQPSKEFFALRQEMVAADK